MSIQKGMLTLVFAGLAFAGPGPAQARAPDDFAPWKKPDFDVFRFWMKPVFGESRAEFTEIFRAGADLVPPIPTLPTSEVAWGSTLEFSESDKLLYLVGAELRPSKWFAFDFQAGFSGSGRGKSLDRDWINSKNWNITFIGSGNVYKSPDRMAYSESEASLNATSRLLETNLYIKILEGSLGRDIEQSMDVSVGYISESHRFRMRSARQLINTGDIAGLPAVGPFGGLDSSYQMDFKGVRLGLREEFVLGRRLSAMGKLGASPYVAYRGEGFWNLRADLRQGDPSFIHKAVGVGFDFSSTLSYGLSRYFSADMGWIWYRFVTRKGSGVTYFSDGTTTDYELESAKFQRYGGYLGLSLRY